MISVDSVRCKQPEAEDREVKWIVYCSSAGVALDPTFDNEADAIARYREEVAVPSYIGAGRRRQATVIKRTIIVEDVTPSRVSDGDGNREDPKGLSDEVMPARPTPNPPPSGDIGELAYTDTDGNEHKGIRAILEEASDIEGELSLISNISMSQSVADVCEQFGKFSIKLATSLQSQAAEIERLQDEADEAKTWPEWAEKILKVLQSHGAAEPDEDGIDLPEALSDWIAGFEAATASEITALKSRIVELENVLAARDAQLTEEIELTQKFAKQALEEAAAKNAAEARLDETTKFIRTLGEELVLAGMPGGDREVILANARAMIARLKDAVKVIKFYADEDNWVNGRPVIRSVSFGDDLGTPAMDWNEDDDGKTARAFLSTTGGDSHG